MIIFTTDLHIRLGLLSYLPPGLRDSIESLKQLREYAEEQFTKHHGKHALVDLGDLFDKEPEPELVSEYLHFVNTIKGTGADMYAIQGQHASHTGLAWYGITHEVFDLHGLSLSKPGYVQVGTHRVAGFNACPPDELKGYLDKLDPSVDILALHQTLRGSLPDIAGRQIWDLDPAWVKPHVKLVALGHIHRPYEAVQGGTKFVYGGSAVQCSFDEPPAKSFLVLHDDGRLERVPLKTRQFEVREVNTQDQLDSLLSVLPDAREGTVVVVKFKADLPDVEARVRAANPKVLFVFKPVAGTAAAQASLPKDLSLLACLPQLVDRAKEGDLFDFLSEALGFQGPAKVIMEKHRHKFLGG